MFILVTPHYVYSKPGDCDIQALVDKINKKLRTAADYHLSIQIDSARTIIVKGAGGWFFRFKVAELVHEQRSEGEDLFGVEAISCNTRTVAPHSYIYFNGENKKLAFLKLKCISEAELAELHQMLILLVRELSIIIA